MKSISDSRVPVAIFAFNRPHYTAKVMEEIRIYAPPIIFLIQDGARGEVVSDSIATNQVRQILEGVDWECQIHRLYADGNMGLLDRFNSGLTQVFLKVDCCIILEDDVLPTQSFFLFAEAALEDFRDDLRIGMVSGYCETKNRKFVLKRHLSRKPKVWGWATWSNRLVQFDPNHNEFANRSVSSSFWILRRRGFSIQESIAWPIRMNRALRIRTWDYQWAYHVISKYGYSLASSTNLISNLGFGENSTNTSLTPPFINFEVESHHDWPLDRSVPEVNLKLDRREAVRRFLKMLSPIGFWLVLRKLAKVW
jgi:hypothetical protein